MLYVGKVGKFVGNARSAGVQNGALVGVDIVVVRSPYVPYSPCAGLVPNVPFSNATDDKETTNVS